MELKLVFYADDFTGATDALEFMATAGATTVLFLKTPTPSELNDFGSLDAIGVAGMTRSMSPSEIHKTLQVDFSKIASLHPVHIHYKVCSTFDSSPEIGNIGVAVSQGLRQFKNSHVPIMVAAPDLGRYVLFGQLFAQMGIGSNGEVYRIDKHPSMSKHPSTPSKEADLRDHLALQGEFETGLIDILDLEKPLGELLDKVARLSKNHEVIFYDGLYLRQMVRLGAILEHSKIPGKPFFSVGSSGIERAIGDYWQQQGVLRSKKDWETIDPVASLLVLCGSVSPITSQQIDYALESGFQQVPIDPNFLVEDLQRSIQKYSELILAYIQAGKSVIVHTAKGPKDPRLTKVNTIAKGLGWDVSRRKRELPKRFGELLGQIAISIIQQIPLQRLVIAGGDTSSYTARTMDIRAVQMIAPIVKGAPLCRVYAKGAPVDGMQINLKGGQVGEKDYFVALENGTLKNKNKLP